MAAKRSVTSKTKPNSRSGKPGREIFSRRRANGENPRISARRKKLIEGLVAGLPVRIAALNAGYPGKSECARVAAHQDLKKPEVKEALALAMDEAGATLKASATVIAAAHAATTTKEFNSFGKVILGTEMVDHVTRLRAAELNAKIRGAFSSGDGVNVNLNIGAIVNLFREESEKRGLPL